MRALTVIAWLVGWLAVAAGLWLLTGPWAALVWCGLGLLGVGGYQPLYETLKLGLYLLTR